MDDLQKPLRKEAHKFVESATDSIHSTALNGRCDDLISVMHQTQDSDGDRKANKRNTGNLQK